MPETTWEFAVLGPKEGRTARVIWNRPATLPLELVPLAIQLGFSEEDLVTRQIGKLADDLVIGEDRFLRGAIVIPDDDGLPAALFGNPLLAEVEA